MESVKAQYVQNFEKKAKSSKIKSDLQSNHLLSILPFNNITPKSKKSSETMETCGLSTYESQPKAISVYMSTPDVLH